MPLYRYERTPGGYKKIVRGIEAFWAGNHVIIKAKIELSGAEATTKIGEYIKASIEYFWNASFSDGYMVTCFVDVVMRPGQFKEYYDRCDVFVTNEEGPSYVLAKPPIYAEMYYHTGSYINWTPAHEFGHMLGLEDKYDEAFYNGLIALFGYDRQTFARPGWEGNIMADSLAPLEKKNLQELIMLHCTKMSTIADDFMVGTNRGMSMLRQGVDYLYNDKALKY